MCLMLFNLYLLNKHSKFAKIVKHYSIRSGRKKKANTFNILPMGLFMGKNLSIKEDSFAKVGIAQEEDWRSKNGLAVRSINYKYFIF